jgi:FRG domain
MSLPELTPKRLRQYKRKGPRCPIINRTVKTLSDYLTEFSSVVIPEKTFWFRGHAEFHWKIMPSALRYSTPELRSKALSLVSEFRRFAEFKLSRPPGLDEDLKWIQLAQHYGLPTRLLDWTQNAAVALYFACLRPTSDGAVLVINPEDLNRDATKGKRRVLDGHLDARLIAPYLQLDGVERKNGKRTIAIHPIWNSERITLQHGAFTLHGSKSFELSVQDAPSLVCLPILHDYKPALLDELERIGIFEMSIFPEPEHICGYLKTSAQSLAPWKRRWFSASSVCSVILKDYAFNRLHHGVELAHCV